MQPHSLTSSVLAREAARLFRFGLPIVIGQVAMVGIGLTNVFVTGRASPEDLAGVTLGNSISTFIFLILGGILFANAPMVGHHYGASDNEAVRKQFQQCLWLAIPLGVTTMLLMAGGRQLVGVLGAEAEVAAIARGYMTPMMLALPCYFIYITIRTTLEATGVPRVAMVLNASGLLLHIPVAWCLVLGKFGLPKLGGVGCGWAALFAVICQIIAAACYLARGKAIRAFALLSSFARPHLDTIREILHLGLPIAGSILFEFGYFSIIPLMVAHLGAEVVSGHSIAFQFDALMFIIPFGISQSITIAISHNLGRKENFEARKSCWAGMSLIAVIALLQVIVYILFRQNIAALFTDDSGVAAIAAQLLLLASGYRFMDALAIGAQGALRGYKITRPTMYIQFVAFWLTGFPLSWSLALTDWWGEPMGVAGFWVGLIFTLTLSALSLCLILWRVQKARN